MRKIFSSLLILISFTQCTEQCETCGQGDLMENYVLKYFVFLDYSNIFIDGATNEPSGIGFEVKFQEGELIDCLFPKNEDALSKFREIAKRNGDTAYNRPVSTCFPYTCLSNKAGRFDICCDKEYAGYPAGTLLNEFCEISFYSAGEFVESGYVSPDMNMPVKQYSKPLNTFNTEEHRLVASTRIFFVLSLKPDYAGEYKFICTYSDNSFKFVYSVAYTFD